MKVSLVAWASHWPHLFAAMPIVYVLLWTGLVAVGVGCVVLFRTRWGQAQPLRKCAVLSLLVHVLLAGLAMTVRFVVGDGDGGGGGGPIRIRIIDGGGGSNSIAMMNEPRLMDSQPAMLDSALPPIAETVLLPDTDNETKQDIVAATPTTAANVPTESATQSVESTPPVAEMTPTATPVVVEPNVDERRQAAAPTTSTNIDATTRPPATMQPIGENGMPSGLATDRAAAAVRSAATNPNPGGDSAQAAPGDPYSGRTAGDRIGLIEGQGGSRETEAAVVAALTWLAAAQSADGHWDAERFGAGVERKTLGEDRRGAGRDADTGISALAILSFLGAGHTHVSGDYQPTVERGLAYLLRTQAADGNLFGAADLYSQMYCHSMATFALAEAQAMTGDRRLDAGVNKALTYSVRAQDPVSGGWRYRPLDPGDTSQLGWQVMALASGERAGVSLPLATWTGVDRFLRSVRHGNAGGLASYRPGSRPTTSMTAEAFYCRLVLTSQAGGSMDERMAAEATQQILSELPTAGRINLYYWYYATLALHHRYLANAEAAAAWRSWNEALTSVLVAGQEKSGPHSGSWAPDMMWGGYGGRIYSTALSAMCLEVYYRYAPQAQPRRTETVTRPGFQPAR